jgi:hypothetical protein
MVSTADSSRPRAKRNVAFVLHRNSYSEPTSERKLNPSDLFYNKEEYSKIEEENKAMAEMSQIPKSLQSSETISMRGLEARTPRGARRRVTNRRRATHAVIDEQSRQEQEGVEDVDMLGEIYKGFTSHCIRQSCDVGSRDARVAKSIYFNGDDLSKSRGRNCRDGSDGTEATELSSSELSYCGSSSEFLEVSKDIAGSPRPIAKRGRKPLFLGRLLGGSKESLES